ncbi:hypothetical protein BN1708_019617, partial [Verticillium longisporum]
TASTSPLTFILPRPTHSSPTLSLCSPRGRGRNALLRAPSLFPAPPSRRPSTSPLTTPSCTTLSTTTLARSTLGTCTALRCTFTMCSVPRRTRTGPLSSGVGLTRAV